ncbi:MAG: hypothetical protein IT186_14015 [Acidobacteria bacterium]|nr:hypothetical protein [Acidobacteriota bacterium]MCG3194031.1 hypothetical protein [Thermoanaerobaculia bacterium]
MHISRIDRLRVSLLLPLAVIISFALTVLLSPGPCFAQPAPEVPPAGPAAPAEAPQPTDVRDEIEKVKASLEELSGGVAISGFFDVQATNRRNDPNVVSMGDFEIDLAREIGKSVQVAAAVVLDAEGAQLAVGFVDFHLFGGLIAPRGRLPVEKGFHVQLGRFDVPFGNDWQYFASKDRIEYSAPLTTEEVMDGGYNDVGLRVFGNTGSFNYSLFGLRGNGPGNLLGGRLGITPLDEPYRLKPRTRVFEAGVSLMYDLGRDGETEETSFAIDSEARIGPFRVRAEYLRRDARPTEQAEQVIRSGWHVTAALEAGEIAGFPLVPYVRYDAVLGGPGETESLGAEGVGGSASVEARTERLTAGLNATLFRIVTLKFEYQRILAAPVETRAQEGFGRDSWFSQVVVAF